MPAAAVVVLVATTAFCAARVKAAGNRLRITNGCQTAPIWIAHEAGPQAGPDPQNVRIDPQQSHNFRTDDGLASTRYWPKMACDVMGNNCGLGNSGGPGELCVGTGDYKKCAPPIDTKFEASFGQSGQPCDPVKNAMAGCDYVDVSLVDGWTLPFHLEINGQCEGGQGPLGPHVIDCSGLSFEACPKAEYLSTVGMTVSLEAINPNTSSVTGCYSPCSKLIDTKWNNELAHGRKAQDPQVAPYCCPTPPESPEACRAGPIKDTAYVKAMHSLCPGVYGFSYDDAVGLLRCSSVTTYNLVFHCPAVLPRSPTEFEGRPRGRRNQKLMVALLAAVAVAAGVVTLMFVSGGKHPQHGTGLEQQAPTATPFF